MLSLLTLLAVAASAVDVAKPVATGWSAPISSFFASGAPDISGWKSLSFDLENPNDLARAFGLASTGVSPEAFRVLETLEQKRDALRVAESWIQDGARASLADKISSDPQRRKAGGSERL